MSLALSVSVSSSSDRKVSQTQMFVEPLRDEKIESITMIIGENEEYQDVLTKVTKTITEVTYQPRRILKNTLPDTRLMLLEQPTPLSRTTNCISVSNSVQNSSPHVSMPTMPMSIPVTPPKNLPLEEIKTDSTPTPNNQPKKLIKANFKKDEITKMHEDIASLFIPPLVPILTLTPAPLPISSPIQTPTPSASKLTQNQDSPTIRLKINRRHPVVSINDRLIEKQKRIGIKENSAENFILEMEFLMNTIGGPRDRVFYLKDIPVLTRLIESLQTNGITVSPLSSSSQPGHDSKKDGEKFILDKRTYVTSANTFSGIVVPAKFMFLAAGYYGKQNPTKKEFASMEKMSGEFKELTRRDLWEQHFNGAQLTCHIRDTFAAKDQYLIKLVRNGNNLVRIFYLDRKGFEFFIRTKTNYDITGIETALGWFDLFEANCKAKQENLTTNISKVVIYGVAPHKPRSPLGEFTAAVPSTPTSSSMPLFSSSSSTLFPLQSSQTNEVQPHLSGGAHGVQPLLSGGAHGVQPHLQPRLKKKLKTNPTVDKILTRSMKTEKMENENDHQDQDQDMDTTDDRDEKNEKDETKKDDQDRDDGKNTSRKSVQKRFGISADESSRKFKTRSLQWNA